ncbi:MAG TPA: hypothetical protein VG406_14100 [Isosphaeraceae bacterium]|jgi:hypothetical protein|nr:hypothetical protein [Isosphaeraceae bacterium]
MSIPASSLMPGQSIPATNDPTPDLPSWIDAHSEDPRHLGALIDRLASITLPEKPWSSVGIETPLSGGIERLAWSWNRAAANLADRGHYQAAAEVWAGHYLACLSLQQKYQYRYHKGMPLCNLGYALARAGHGSFAAKSTILGVIEDALTDPATAIEHQSAVNLLRWPVAPAVIEQLITTVQSRFLDLQTIMPVLPETVVEIWRSPALLAPSERCMGNVDEFSSRLRENYPRLSDPANCSKILGQFWSFADWSEGIIRGR